MTYAELEKWFEDNYFLKSSVQNELPTYFDSDAIVSDAVVEGTRQWKGDRGKLDRLIGTWEDVVLSDKADSIADKNLAKDIETLDRLTGLSSDGQRRVDDRIGDLISKRSARELIDLDVSASVQESVRKELGNKATDLTRSDLSKIVRGGMSIKTVARGLDLSRDDATTLLEKEGFTVTEKGIVRQ